MKENRFERIARHTGQSKERAQLRTHLRVLNKEKLKQLFAMIIHYWARYKFFISSQSFLNLWCKLNQLCHDIDESFPDPHDEHELVKDYCKAHPYYFIDILPPKMVISLFRKHFDDKLDILATMVQKLDTEGLRAACECVNVALGLDENVDELVAEIEKHIKEFSC